MSTSDRLSFMPEPDLPAVMGMGGWSPGERRDSPRAVRETRDLLAAYERLSARAARLPESSAVQNELGVFLFRLGESPRAGEHFAKALALDPRSSVVQQNLACCFEAEGRLHDALRLWLDHCGEEGPGVLAWARAKTLFEQIMRSGDDEQRRAARELVQQGLGALAPTLELGSREGSAALPEASRPAPAVTEPPEDPRYQEWIKRHAFGAPDRLLVTERLAALERPPRVHVLVEASRTPWPHLLDTLRDVAAQCHPPFRVTVLAACACPQAFADVPMLEWLDAGERANATAIDAVRRGGADWVALVPGGDRIEPHALALMVLQAARQPERHLIYCDEDRISDKGARFDPRFKPDLNPDLLRSSPYLGRFVFARREALEALEEPCLVGAAASYDLALEILDARGEAAIGHVAELLYHRRASSDRPADGAAEEAAALGALRRHLARNRIDADATEGFLPSTFRVAYRHRERPPVSIIVPTRDRLDLITGCIGSLLGKTTYPNYEILVVDNGSRQSEVLAYLDSLPSSSGGRVRVLRDPGPFNHSAMNNRAAREARGEYLLLLNDDTRIIQEQWLENMMAHGMRPEVGAVGARLLFADGSLQHAGVIVGMAGVADHAHMGLPLKDPGYMGRAQVDQNFSAVTAACMLVRKSVFFEVGALDEDRFAVLFNDVDLCLKIGRRGLKVVWTPSATVVHYGSVSQNTEKPDPKKLARIRREQSGMRERWARACASDPAFNPHLSLMNRHFRVETQVDVPWNPLLRDRPRIMGFPADRAGSGHYRVLAPLEALRRAGRAECALLPDQSAGRMPTLWEVARAAPDTLLLQCAVQVFQLDRMQEWTEADGPFKVFELDDLKTKVPAASAHHGTLPKDLRQRLERALALCDRLVVSTEPLREAYRRLIGDIRVVPNFIERSRWEGLRPGRHDGSRPRVGWAGGASHGGDLALLEPIMKELAGEVDFVLLGMCPQALRPYVREFHPGVSLHEYPAKLASLELDLALAPLEINRFNEAKSNLRLLEYGILGWPVIGTEIEPYRGSPARLVANRPAAWIEAIREHLADPAAALAAGDRLRAWVLEDWMLEDHLDAWVSALTP